MVGTWPVVVMMVFYLYLLLRPQPVKSMFFFSLGMGATAMTLLLGVFYPLTEGVSYVLQAIFLTGAFVLAVPAVGPEALDVWRRRGPEPQPGPERTETPERSEPSGQSRPPEESDRPRL